MAEPPRAVRAALIAACGSGEPSVVVEALGAAKPYAAHLGDAYAQAEATLENLSREGSETARRLLQCAETGDAQTSEIQRAIIRFAPVLQNAELQSLTRQLTDSLGARAAVAAASPRQQLSTPREGIPAAGVIGQYRVVQKAVARAGFELTSAAVDVFSPGRIVEVVERRVVTDAGAGHVRVRCSDGSWLSVYNRAGEPAIAELPGSPSLAAARYSHLTERADDDSRPSTPGEDDTAFELRANAQLDDAVGRMIELPEGTPQLRLVQSDFPGRTESLREFEEAELAAEMEVLKDERQRRQERQHEDQRQVADWQSRGSPSPPTSPALPTPIPFRSAAHPASNGGDGMVGEAGDVQRVTDASLSLCEVVVGSCQLPADTAVEVEAMLQEQRERWGSLVATLLRAQATSSGEAWEPSALRLLVQHVQGYQKASLRGFLELTYALDEALRGSQTVISGHKVAKVSVSFDESSYGRPLGLKFVQSSEWTRTGSVAGGGMVVKTVTDGGAAAMVCPGLTQGAVLVGINDKVVSALTYGQTANLLKVAGQARPLELTFTQVTAARSHSNDSRAGRVASRIGSVAPLTATERERVLEVVGRQSSLPPSELAAVLAVHEEDGYDALCSRVAKAFGHDPRQPAAVSRGSPTPASPAPPDGGSSVEVEEMRAMQSELLAELEAQSALNAEWALKHEELEMEVGTLTAEVADLRTENESYRGGEAVGAWSGRGRHGAVVEAVEAVSDAAAVTLDRRALLLGPAVGGTGPSVAEVMGTWHALLECLRAGWRSEPRVAASVGSLGSAIEVTLSTLQQLGTSLAEAEDEVLQMRAELASVHSDHFQAAALVGGSAPLDIEGAQAEISELRAQLADLSSALSPSGSPTHRAAAEATATAAAARALVGTLRASLSQMVDEIDRLHQRTQRSAARSDLEPAAEGGGDASSRSVSGLSVEEGGGSVRSDLAEVAQSLQKLGEIGTATSASRTELATSRREVSTLEDEIRGIRDGQAAAASMHSAEEVAEKDGQIAALAQEIDQLHARWDTSERMRKLAAGSVATESGGVGSLLKTNDQLTSQLQLMTSQIEAIMRRDTRDGEAMTQQLFSP